MNTVNKAGAFELGGHPVDWEYADAARYFECENGDLPPRGVLGHLLYEKRIPSAHREALERIGWASVNGGLLPPGTSRLVQALDSASPGLNLGFYVGPLRGSVTPVGEHSKILRAGRAPTQTLGIEGYGHDAGLGHLTQIAATGPGLFELITRPGISDVQISDLYDGISGWPLRTVLAPRNEIGEGDIERGMAAITTIYESNGFTDNRDIKVRCEKLMGLFLTGIERMEL